MKKRRVILLGATGSIGASTVKVAQALPDRMQVVGLAAYQSAAKLAEQANLLRPPVVALADPEKQSALRQHLAYSPKILLGPEGLIELCTNTEADLVLVAIVGTSGLPPALAALECGKDLAVASKEILVMAGDVVTRLAKEKNRQILPVDSEHNAIFQCLSGGSAHQVRSLILTASGGPFRTWPADKLADATPSDALKHPTWKMGRKISIDSATLFNKGLEMIEARWLFGVAMSQVEVVVHPQSLVHSLVEFKDGSILAQLSHSDMCFPIQYAVTWPDRVDVPSRRLRLSEIARLDFEEPRYQDFPALRLAREAGETGGIMPAVLNAANEIAVQAFLDGEIRFPQIWELVEGAMQRTKHLAEPTLDDILQADALIRETTLEAVQNVSV